MTDTTGNSTPDAGAQGAGALAGAVAGAGEAPAGGAQAGGSEEGNSGAAALPGWMDGLPEELRGDADLARYADVASLAKGLKETRTWARGRVALPGADDDAGWRELGEKLRPEKPADYAFDMPEGSDPAQADAWREFAHGIGMPQRWAKAVADFHHDGQAKAIAMATEKASGELQAIELEMGPSAYARGLEGVNAMLREAGIDAGKDADALRGLQSAYGAGPAMKLLMHLAGRTGEMGRVDGAAVDMRIGAMTPESAKAEQIRLSGDKDFMARAREKGSPEAQRWNRLNEIQAATTKR